MTPFWVISIKIYGVCIFSSIEFWYLRLMTYSNKIWKIPTLVSICLKNRHQRDDFWRFLKILELFQSFYQITDIVIKQIYAYAVLACVYMENLLGGILKLRWQARGRGSLPNVNACQRGGGGSHGLVNVDKLI